MSWFEEVTLYNAYDTHPLDVGLKDKNTSKGLAEHGHSTQELKTGETNRTKSVAFRTGSGGVGQLSDYVH